MSIIILLILGISFPLLLLSPVGDYVEERTTINIDTCCIVVVATSAILIFLSGFYIADQEDIKNVNLSFDRSEELQQMEGEKYYDISTREYNTYVVFLVNGKFYKENINNVIIEHGDTPQVIFYNREFKSVFNRALDISNIISKVQYIKLIVP